MRSYAQTISNLADPFNLIEFSNLSLDIPLIGSMIIAIYCDSIYEYLSEF